MARGDARAFEAIYERHSGAAYSLAYRMVGARSAAEDVVQEAFLNLWRSGAHYDRVRGSVRTWILGIVHHRAIDALRRASVHSKRRSDDETAAERLEAPERVEEDVARRDEAAIVRNAMEILPVRPVEGDRARLLRRFHPCRDRRDARAADRHREGAHAPGFEEDARGARAGSGRMTTGPEHDRWEDAAATYVLGALPEDERHGYEAHLKTCPVCRDEVEDLRVAAEALPSSPPPMLPPPALKARIMAEVEREAAAAGLRGRAARCAPKPAEATPVLLRRRARAPAPGARRAGLRAAGGRRGARRRAVLQRRAHGRLPVDAAAGLGGARDRRRRRDR